MEEEVKKGDLNTIKHTFFQGYSNSWICENLVNFHNLTKKLRLIRKEDGPSLNKILNGILP